MVIRSRVKSLAFSAALLMFSIATPAKSLNECAKQFSFDSIPCRIHGFEFCTSPHISGALRTKVFDALGRVQSKLGFDSVVTAVIQNHLATLDGFYGRKVGLIELGSGAGDLVLKLAKADALRSFLLTDIFPQIEVWRKNINQSGSLSNVQYLESPLPAAEIGKLDTFPGDVVLTVAMLHHLQPAEVDQFLKQVVQKKLNVIIVEPLARRMRDVFIGAGAGLASLGLYAEAWRDPRVPFILSHDGIVSALRQYTIRELQEKLEGTGYQALETSGLGPVGSFRVMFLNAR